MAGTTTVTTTTTHRRPTETLIDPGSSLPQERAATPRTAHGLAPERLEAEIVTLVGRLSSATYDLLVLVGELDSRGTFARRGSLSCAAWLADHCDIELATARTQVRVARAMRAHPLLDAAMRDGEVCYARARALVPHLTNDNVDALIELARTNPTGRLGAAIAAWSQRHDDTEVIAVRQHDERSVSWRTRGDGMVTLAAILTPEAAGAVGAVIDTHLTRADAPPGASLAQQRADALVAVITRGGGSPRAEVVVHVREDGNTLADGTPLSDHAVTEMLPEAFVSLLISDKQRRPIDASPRRRFPTRRQRRVLDERDPECAHPGCHARAFLQYDHIEPYTQGGPTVLDNLQRLCGPHNRAKNPRPGGPG